MAGKNCHSNCRTRSGKFKVCKTQERPERVCQSSCRTPSGKFVSCTRKSSATSKTKRAMAAVKKARSKVKMMGGVEIMSYFADAKGRVRPVCRKGRKIVACPDRVKKAFTKVRAR